MVNGKPLVFKSAVAYSKGGSAIFLELSTANPECGDFAGKGRMLARGEKYATLIVAPVLNPDGTQETSITYMSFASHSKQGQEIGSLSVERADPTDGIRGALDITFVAEANDFLKRPRSELTLKGPFEARGCGLFGAKDGPSPQKGVSLKIADKAFDVVGARIKPTTFPSPGFDLELSTAPMTCSSWDSGDVNLKLHFAKDKAVSSATLSGAVFQSPLSVSLQEKEPSIALTTKNETDTEVELVARGALTIMDYGVSLAGELRAIPCSD
jgi:hypothetical protein